MNLTLHIVSSGDTLQEIAVSQLGDITQVDAIASINALRYPYISDDPYDQYAHAKGTLQVTSTVNAGSTSVKLGNSGSIVVNALDTLFFSDRTTGLYEAQVVQTPQLNSDGSVTVTLQGKMVNSYSLSAVVTVFTNQENVTTKVLKTGDMLYLPADQTSVNQSLVQTQDIYGADIQVDDYGTLIKSGNDLAVVSGVQNVQQAVGLQWRTPYGSHPMEEDYGNRQFTLLGEENQPYFWTLSETFATQCALSDPRVSAVDNLTLTVTDDQQSITADVTPTNSNVSYTTTAILGGE